MARLLLYLKNFNDKKLTIFSLSKKADFKEFENGTLFFTKYNMSLARNYPTNFQFGPPSEMIAHPCFTPIHYQFHYTYSTGFSVTIHIVFPNQQYSQ